MSANNEMLDNKETNILVHNCIIRVSKVFLDTHV